MHAEREGQLQEKELGPSRLMTKFEEKDLALGDIVATIQI